MQKFHDKEMCVHTYLIKGLRGRKDLTDLTWKPAVTAKIYFQNILNFTLQTFMKII